MTSHHLARLLVTAALILSACGDSGSDNNSNEESNNANNNNNTAPDRGGPDSLVGVSWQGAAQTINGLTLQPTFSFGRDSVTVTNTCNGTVSVSVTAPARYTYKADIAKRAAKSETDGTNTCDVSIEAGSFDFEIVEAGLLVTVMEQMLTFAPRGAVAGLYGEWVAPAPGVGQLVWSMGKGKLTASAVCDSGLTATATTSAAFTNILTITESAQDSVEEGGVTCDAAINAGTFTYRFDGGVLVLIAGGQEIRFDPA